MSTQFTNRQWRLPNNENKDKQSNYSMDFDGTGGIQCGDIPQLNSATKLSFNVWVNYENMTQRIIFSKEDSTNAIRLYNWTSGVLYFWLKNSGSGTVSYVSNFSSLVNLNEWNMLTVVYDGSQASNNDRVKIFLNGGNSNILTNYGTIPTSTGNITDSFAIGEYSSGAGNKFLGKLDAVSIFNYALSSSQITTLYGSSSTGIGNPMSLSPKPVFYAPLGDQDAFNGANYLVPNSSLKDYVFDFDGSNDYIDINSLNSNILNSSFSIGIWIKKEAKPSQDNDRIIDLTVNANTSFQIICDNSSSKFAINFILSGVSKINQRGFNSWASTSNKWNQIFLTWNGSSYVYYFNGQPVSSTGTVPLGIAGTGFFLGKRADGNVTTFYKGEMSNVSIFDSALPATGSNSVETLYNNGSPLTSMSGFSSLQGWWKLDASATYDGSNWTIPDDSTNSNDGTSSGMTQANLVQSNLSFTSGYSPYALDFDGANDYIETGLIDITGNKTISLWINPTATGNNGAILTISQAGASSDNISIGLWESNIQVLMVQNSYKKRSTTTIDANTWYNVVIVKSTNAIDNIYINSSNTTLNDTGAWNATIDSSQSNIGKASFNSATNFQYFNGSISNCSVWNAALTSAQVTEIYSEGVPSNLNNHSAYSNLVSWWQLGSNSSFNTNWTVLDEKGSNNGTSSNMGEDAIVDGVGSYANGTSSGMGGDEVIGDAPYSTANSLSVNMDVLDRVTDTPS